MKKPIQYPSTPLRASFQGKQFYSHLVEIDILHLELETLDLTEEEKIHLKSLITSNLHHTILDTVLSELSEKDKKEFLEHFVHEDHVKIWEHLKLKIKNIEDKIKKTTEILKEELYKDIKEAKEKKDQH